MVKRIQGFSDLLCRICFFGTSVLKRVQLHLEIELSSHAPVCSCFIKKLTGVKSLHLILTAVLDFGNKCNSVGHLTGFSESLEDF